jgi:methylase of polypeptide subunit release factors
VVAEMLKLARVAANDVVYDLGCGDGRIVIAAAKEHGARAVCVDIDPRRIRESRANAERAGVAERITFLTQDFFQRARRCYRGDAVPMAGHQPEALPEAVARAEGRHPHRVLRS